MSRCQTCAVDGHDTCWDVKPDRSCPCCLDTWFDMLVTPTMPASDSEGVSAMRKMNGIWIDRVSLDDPHHRDQYRQDRLRVAWAMLADGLVGVLSLGHLRSCWSVRATNDLVRCTFQARRREG